MTEIVIKTCGSVPNVDAMEACIKFVYTNYASRRGEGYKCTRTVTTKRGFKVEVKEDQNHPNKNESPCSVIFNVRKFST